MPFNYKTEIDRYRRYYQNISEVAHRPQPQAYTTAIFSFLAVSLFGWYAIRPTIQTILFLQREITDNKTVSQQMDDKIGKLIEAQVTYQEIQGNLSLLTQALPENSDAVSVVAQLKALGSASQASISAITVSSVPLTAGVATPSGIKTQPAAGSAKLAFLPSRKVSDVPITVVSHGTFGSIESFLNGIISMRRIVTVEGISLVPDFETRSGSPSADISLRMVLKLTARYIE